MPATLNAADRRQLLERFLRYVAVDTQSDDASTTSPSTEKQKDLARLLADELRALGCGDAAMNEWGYVFATIPGNLPTGHPAAGSVPTIGLIAHMDTYFATPGGGVRPRVIESYDGSDIELGPGQVLDVTGNPNLARCVGQTLIHTDGTTLLGADDKAGVAEIMTLVAWLRDHPEFLHGPIRIAFTTDEEVGRGTEHFDVGAFGADYAYTLDGSDLGEIEDETFCADTALVTVTGHDVHPGYAKGKLVNAVRVAAAIIDRLDPNHLPETTEARQPYLHPYTISGNVSAIELKLLVRAFSIEELREREDHLRQVIAGVSTRFPAAKIDLAIQESYRNMAYKIREDIKVLDYALEAVKRVGIEPKRQAIRGGTDGARLSFMGLLTPNIWAGGQSFHSVREWVSLEWMAAAVAATLEILTVWVERSAKA
ncbi:MAG TPA: peptidase T [Thermoanaerobaculales bacterium]|nr:peptidase T [Thermoanaerobaculales bacterium]HQL30144.1 peptidase T [Thermoanaerobaculales bacterium]